MSKLIIQNISKKFGNLQVLDNLSLNVEKKDFQGIIGLSGSGKTTLLNILIGLYRPDSGDILYKKDNDYLKISESPIQLWPIFGFAPQDPSFYNRLTVWENLDHFGSLYRIPKQKRIETISSLLKLVDLEDSRNTLGEHLSGGMQRRLGIACSMIHEPDILILDEPTADLDPVLRKEIWNLLYEINNSGTTILLTTHFLNEVEGLCNKLAILHKNKFVAKGTPDELKKSFVSSDEVTLHLVGGNYGGIVNSLKASKYSISKIAHKGHKLVVYSPEAEKILHYMLHLIEKKNLKLINIYMDKPSLTEIFESIVT